jgi:cellulose synthase (UDP-forming)
VFSLVPDHYLPIIVLAFLGLAYPASKEPGKALTFALICGLAFVVGRYFWWRLTETLVPPEGITLAVTGIWFVFALEVCAWFDASILYAQLSRRTDRTPEADAHETRLRALPPSDLPYVDILITTYNEPLEVLERTILGARALDWPSDRINVFVLDDGGRDWLETYCWDRGVFYLTREGNEHAKAGNINAALKRTSSEFFMILDADFIPQQNMLYRMIGFFEDPQIGIVQVPHEFFNFDPLQTNLAMRASLPSDQKMFFREIMRGRDGWDCAFCCGSNSITRRKAIEAIGGAMPTGSITEDMLLTMALLRAGYKTRYLCERLAVGLAPESLDAFFVQRSRWAQGAIQILYLRTGPWDPA